ncbi:MAG: helix-turn-helix domain-containing protein [Halanaerobiales bacterium]
MRALSEPEKLNQKQIEILKFSAEGLTEKALALKLKISVNTIKYHKRKLYRILKVNSITGAVIKAIKDEYISINDINL